MDKSPKSKFPTTAEFQAAAELTLSRRHHRQAATRETTAALHDLHARLAQNALLYEVGDLQDERDAVTDSLIATQQCLASLGFQLATLMPLTRPAITLAQREQNILDPMFCARLRPGRPKATMEQQERTGMLAAFSEFWLTCHRSEDLKQDQQLGRLARVLKGPWFGKVTAGTLKSARNLVSVEAKDHIAVQTARNYEHSLSLAAERHGYENAIPIMVRFLNDLPPTFGGGIKQIL